MNFSLSLSPADKHIFSTSRHRIRSGRNLAVALGVAAVSNVAFNQSLWAQNKVDQDILQHTSIGLPVEQVGRYIDDVDPELIKFARAGMYDPRMTMRVTQGFKTAEFKDLEEKARQAILDPERFRRAQEEAEARKGPKTSAEKAAQERERQQRDEAKRAITHPDEVAQEKQRTKDPARKRREEIARQSILDPRKFNEAIESHKTDQLRQREADAIYAFTQPEAFLEERERLKKTGSRAPIKTTAPTQPIEESKTKPKDKSSEGGRP